MYLKTFVFALFITSPLIMMGCVNVPPEAEASVPLVHNSLSYSLKSSENEAINIPELTAQDYNKGAASIIYSGNTYKSSKAYLSASGNKCIRFISNKKVHLTEPASMQVTACQRNGQWLMIPSLVSKTEG
ncbi:hypothetical protein [Alteromonas sp. A079]|uniref:hypothetical protein n=1 Tax=Alteromonas sp. A079 TaxID=3410268 RepID=UPI003B9F2969